MYLFALRRDVYPNLYIFFTWLYVYFTYLFCENYFSWSTLFNTESTNSKNVRTGWQNSQQCREKSLSHVTHFCNINMKMSFFTNHGRKYGKAGGGKQHAQNFANLASFLYILVINLTANCDWIKVKKKMDLLKFSISDISFSYSWITCLQKWWVCLIQLVIIHDIIKHVHCYNNDITVEYSEIR